jgi:post-segregation antitoxin (ccd killing protein)
MYGKMHINLVESEVIMPSPLNIRDIGEDRKAALELEAKATGNSIAEVVRDWIDAGIARSRAERDRAAWIASAKEGIADESSYLEQNGPSLARFRQV